jgi:tartrate dehydratase alpha subunit/fumarate hydratase class I-like protein
VLPIPRSPSGLLQALYHGHRAREEIAFQTFVSRVVRELRASLGEPAVTIMAVSPDAIEVRIAAAMGGATVQTHRWQLHPLDALEGVVRSILDFLAECRVERIEMVESLVGA